MGGSGHHTKSIDVTDRASNEFCSRVVFGERSPDGLGFNKIICHSNLQPNYLKDNYLKLCIKEVKLKNRSNSPHKIIVLLAWVTIIFLLVYYLEYCSYIIIVSYHV